MMADWLRQHAQPPSALTVARLGELVAMPRRTSCRLVGRTPSKATPCRLREPLPRIALAWPSSGDRRLTHELARRGVRAHPQLVRRLMRTENRLCVRQRRVGRPTDARHPWPTSPNLAPQPVLTGLQRWGVAEMTDIQRAPEVVDRAVTLAAVSRRGLGWALERQLPSQLALAARQRAITTRGGQPGLVHHADRGVQ
jgi:putative transposase